MEIARLKKISDYVFHHAELSPRAEALVWRDTRISYAQLARAVEQVSLALIAHGIERGDRVALLGTPRPEFFIVMMAAADIGAIWMGIHPRYTLHEMSHVIETASPKLVFSYREIDGRDYRDDLAELAQRYPSIEQIIMLDEVDPDLGIGYESFLCCGAESMDRLPVARAAVQSDDSAVIIFTSGTTGRPKAAMNSHFGLVHCARVELGRWPAKDLRLLQNMPINHIANIGMMSSYALVAGGTLVFMDRFDPGEILRTIENERITFWLQAPAMFHLVINHADFETTDLSSLQYIVWGGGPMPQHMVERLGKLGARLAMAYGMTELTAYASYSDADASVEVLANTIGKPEPSYQLRLMKADWSRPAIGESGEIQAKGRWLMNGYFNDSQATAEAFSDDGWFKTGDVAELREDGNWTLVGRSKEMYKSGGFNIYPREIEMAIEEHPAVAMAAVLGTPDPVYDEVGYAFVQLQPDQKVDVDALNHWCRQRLANYKVPKTFEIVTELPRLAIGKIDKQGLKRRLAESSHDEASG
ncbi:MAG: acyl-CoA synthetase (AMP-forming)/AMP-acid ligase II [Planctomycetota bacterium]